MFKRLSDFVRGALGVELSEPQAEALDAQGRDEEGRPLPVPPVGARALRTMLKRDVPPTWFTKRHTPGVRAGYAQALTGMGAHSRRWAIKFFGRPWED